MQQQSYEEEKTELNLQSQLPKYRHSDGLIEIVYFYYDVDDFVVFVDFQDKKLHKSIIRVLYSKLNFDQEKLKPIVSDHHHGNIKVTRDFVNLQKQTSVDLYT